MGWQEQMVVRALPRPLVSMAGQARAHVRNRAAARTYGPLVDQLLPGTTSQELVVASDDAVVFRVVSPSGPLILKLATTDTAVRLLAAEADALDELASMDDLAGWRSLVAAVEQRGEHARGTWITQTVLPGVTTQAQLVAGSPDLTTIAERACLALRPVHELTSATGMANDVVLDHVVTNPIKTIRQWRPSLAAELTAINGEVRQRLASLDLVRSRNHGDFAPSNVLWNRETGAVSGIVDWRLHPVVLPPEVDYVQFVLSSLMIEHNREFGSCIVALIADEPVAQGHTLIEHVLGLGPNRFDVRTGVVLAWLHHVAFGFDKARRFRRNPIWLANNVDAVARALQPG